MARRNRRKTNTQVYVIIGIIALSVLYLGGALDFLVSVIEPTDVLYRPGSSVGVQSTTTHSGLYRTSVGSIALAKKSKAPPK